MYVWSVNIEDIRLLPLCTRRVWERYPTIFIYHWYFLLFSKRKKNKPRSVIKKHDNDVRQWRHFRRYTRQILPFLNSDHSCLSDGQPKIESSFVFCCWTSSLTGSACSTAVPTKFNGNVQGAVSIGRKCATLTEKCRFHNEYIHSQDLETIPSKSPSGKTVLRLY